MADQVNLTKEEFASLKIFRVPVVGNRDWKAQVCERVSPEKVVTLAMFASETMADIFVAALRKQFVENAKDHWTTILKKDKEKGNG